MEDGTAVCVAEVLSVNHLDCRSIEDQYAGEGRNLERWTLSHVSYLPG